MRQRTIVSAVVLTTLVVVGCSTAGQRRASTPGRDSTSSTTPARAVKVPTAPIDADGPDPAVLAADGSYWLFTTSSDHLIVPVRTATKQGSWSAPKEALLRPPSWSGRAEVWAPAVLAVGDRFLMWFASPRVADEPFSQCIGVAVADEPGGPYEPIGSEPTICDTDGSTIDPFLWRAADGGLYVAWTQYHFKSGAPTQILASALDDSGTQLVGERRVLLTDPSGWEQIVLENPALFDQPDGTVRLLYSGSFYFWPDYATGTATCDGPLGPCRRDTPGRPWFGSTGPLQGPGGLSVFRSPDDTIWAAFHAWGDRVGYDQGGRRAPHIVPLADLPALPAAAP